MKRGIVYGLFDPGIGRYRYVGQTWDEKRRRKTYSRRRVPRKGGGNRLRDVDHWINSLIDEGRLPEFVVLTTADDQVELDRLETEKISLLQELGHPLTNLTSGGQGNRTRTAPSEAQREQLRRLNSSPEHLERLRLNRERIRALGLSGRRRKTP